MIIPRSSGDEGCVEWNTPGWNEKRGGIKWCYERQTHLFVYWLVHLLAFVPKFGPRGVDSNYQCPSGCPRHDPEQHEWRHACRADEICAHNNQRYIGHAWQ